MRNTKKNIHKINNKTSNKTSNMNKNNLKMLNNIITVSRSINTIPTSKNIIIPILLSQIKTKSLFTIVGKCLNYPISQKYEEIFHDIEKNFKNKKLNMTLTTIPIPEDKTKSKSKSKKKHTKKNTNNNNTNKAISQLLLIAIDDTEYDSREHHKYDDLELCRITGNALFKSLKQFNIEKATLVDTLSKTQLLCLLEGLLLSSYQFRNYKTNKSLDKEKYNLEKLYLISGDVVNNDIESLLIQIDSVFLSRNLVNEPANAAKANRFITMMNQYIKEYNIPVEVDIMNKSDLEKLGMGLILAVGRGSNKDNEPCVVIVKYKGSGDDSRKDYKPEYILLGKGITFDTGGLDVKGGKSMYEMKTDLAGAATVISFLLGYARRGGNKSVFAVCPFAENSIGPNSVKPSDVVKAYDGRTVEIADTDAEGRLVLADCLAYVVEKYPAATIIDFATLTGQQEALSCKMFSNVLSVNSDVEVKKLVESGNKINELLVELPMMEKYKKNLESYVADIKNIPFNCSAGIIMSALFMRQFLKKDTKWIHIDIAGPSYRAENIIKYSSPEASGVGVRLLFEYLG